MTPERGSGSHWEPGAGHGDQMPLPSAALQEAQKGWVGLAPGLPKIL